MNEEQMQACAAFIANFAEQLYQRGNVPEEQSELLVTLAAGTLLATVLHPIEPTASVGDAVARMIKSSVYRCYHPGREFRVVPV